MTAVTKSGILNKIPYLKKADNPRDETIRKNVLASFAFQFFSNLLGLLIVPLSLSYMDKEKYGIWITASALITWFQNMNFGIGLGMQNKVAEALAQNQTATARQYVSIAYKYTTFISLALLFVALVVSGFINWNALFNTNVDEYQLKWATWIPFIAFIFYFIFINITPLLFALNQSSVPNLISLVINISILIFLFIISKVSHNNIIYAAIAFSVPTPLVLLTANWIYFKKYPSLKPQWINFEKEKIRQVFSIGGKFFVMQLAGLFLQQSGIFIVAQYLGPKEVTPFNLINRYFFFVFFIFSLALTPYWTAFTQAYLKKDFVWIRGALKKLFNFALVGTAIILLMYGASFYLIPIWSRHSFDIWHYEFLIFSCALYTIIVCFTTIISIFLNAISRLNIQLIVQVIMAVIVIPLTILFIKKLHWGGASVNMALIICNMIYLIICGWEVNKVFRANKII